MNILAEADAKLVLQVLNNLANFLEYDPRRVELEPYVETLEAVFARMKTEFKSPTGLGEFTLTAVEVRAVIAATQEIVASLGNPEFRFRTGYEPTAALDLAGRLSST